MKKCFSIVESGEVLYLQNSADNDAKSGGGATSSNDSIFIDNDYSDEFKSVMDDEIRDAEIAAKNQDKKKNPWDNFKERQEDNFKHYLGFKLTGGKTKNSVVKALTKKYLKDGMGKTAAKKAAAKAAAKVGSKAFAKSMLKRVPFIGAGVGLGSAYNRLTDGDLAGAGIDAASGIASFFPGLGTGASMALDSYNMYRDMGDGIGESSNVRGFKLYDVAKFIFESKHGVNESGDECSFDDYIFESNVRRLPSEISESVDRGVFCGGNSILEATTPTASELEDFVNSITKDGKISYDELKINPSDNEHVKTLKRLISDSLKEKATSSNTQKLEKKYFEEHPDEKDSIVSLYHQGIDNMSDSVRDKLPEFGIPKSISAGIGRPLGMAAASTIGGLMLGPVGALAGAGIAKWLSDRHRKYKDDLYNKTHKGSAVSTTSKSWTPVIGAGLGSFLGPVGTVLGTGVGYAIDKFRK